MKNNVLIAAAPRTRERGGEDREREREEGKTERERQEREEGKRERKLPSVCQEQEEDRGVGEVIRTAYIVSVKQTKPSLNCGTVVVRSM